MVPHIRAAPASDSIVTKASATECRPVIGPGRSAARLEGSERAGTFLLFAEGLLACPEQSSAAGPHRLHDPTHALDRLITIFASPAAGN